MIRRRAHAFQAIKVLLLALTCASAVGLFFFYRQDVNADVSSDELPEAQESWAGDTFTTKALNANFDAVDEKGQHYTIKASSALELPDGKVDLTSPTYTIALTNGTNVLIASLSGVLDQENKRLSLKGDVVVHYGDEYTIKTPVSDIDLRYGYAQGNDKIQGESKDLHLVADQYKVEEKGDRITLKGHAKLHFHKSS